MVKLDNQQEQAVKTDSTRALVLAGAGSGKTRVLIERIAHLIEHGASPHEILAFTFTRKAAGEMKTRLTERIGENEVTMATMHAIALEMLQRFGYSIGLKTSNATVYSQWESDYLLKHCAIELGVFKKSWKPRKKDIDAAFNAYYSKGIVPGRDDPVRGLFDYFIATCKQNNALTYGSLLIGLEMMILLLAKHLHYRHILVDEVQDIDVLQWTIIERLVLEFNATLFVVGDVSQSIYEWRGAKPDYLLTHQDKFDIYRIETNYRSQAPIVSASNVMIRNNQMRLPLEMKAVRETTDKIKVVPGMDSTRLAGVLSLDPNREDTVVLCRVHGVLAKLSRLLEDKRISHTYVGAKNALTNSEEFRRFHAFLKLYINPYDNFSFLLIYKLMGITDDEYRQIRTHAVNEGKSHLHAWLEIPDYKWGGISPYKDFFQADTKEAYRKQSLASSAFLIKYMATGAAPFPEPGWSFDVEEIFQFIFAWLSKNHKGTTKQYLRWLATYDLQDDIAETRGLKLMTIHAAKGLEFKKVIVAGVNESLLPSSQAIKNDEIESERRLAYVAWTRAEDKLILTVRPVMSEYGNKDGVKRMKVTPRSRFIEESGV